MTTIKQLEYDIRTFEMYDVTIKSVLKMKKLSDNISNYIKHNSWIGFEEDLTQVNLESVGIVLDDKLMNKKDLPYLVIHLIKNKLQELYSIGDEEQKQKIKDINVKLSELCIKYEDIVDEFINQVYYLEDLIDVKFEWLEEDEEFNKISNLLTKISDEINMAVSEHIENKRKFYSDFINQKYKEENGDIINESTKLYVYTYVHNYIVKNFTDIFNSICFDVIEQNGITDEEDIKSIISLYYDYCKQNARMQICIDNIDIRTKLMELL